MPANRFTVIPTTVQAYQASLLLVSAAPRSFDLRGVATVSRCACYIPTNALGLMRIRLVLAAPYLRYPRSPQGGLRSLVSAFPFAS
jgi:hypothetical protein